MLLYKNMRSLMHVGFIFCYIVFMYFFIFFYTVFLYSIYLKMKHFHAFKYTKQNSNTIFWRNMVSMCILFQICKKNLLLFMVNMG
ncbi:hypothetical protein D0Y65_036321 [Glycine soja]|uniref:Uncharacterized protein n=1 Tax=Glycine soja TaxID=3848 RepID=A0A445HE40_GLYSO|nr:hypothetical protein JHK86_041030 [Glycine max]RZB71877.1 hypothetical protein D0Y65_036321 [Glycine soja]